MHGQLVQRLAMRSVYEHYLNSLPQHRATSSPTRGREHHVKTWVHVIRAEGT